MIIFHKKKQFWGTPLFSDQAKMVPPPHCLLIHPLSQRSEDRAAPADGTSSGSCSNCCASGGVGGCGAGTEGCDVRKMGHWGIWVCLKIGKTPKNPLVNDHYPY